MKPSENRLKDKIVGKVRAQFDGIRFLWQRSETRYLLHLIAALLVSMFISFGLVTVLTMVFGSIELLMILFFLLQPIFVGWFLFILFELVRFYWNDRKYKLFPERNPLLQMKYWSAQTSKRHLKHLLLVVLTLSIIVLGGFLLYFSGVAYWLWMFYEIYFGLIQGFFAELFMGFVYVIIGIWFVLGFISARGTMKAFGDRYVEKFQKRKNWFFVFLPLPWIFLVCISLWIRELYAVSHLLGGVFGGFWVTSALFLYGLISILGLVVLPNRNWWARYTACQIAVSYTFLSVVLIPLFIGLFIGLLGPVVSFLAVGYNFIRDTLDEHGDELREYYEAWDRKLERFGITSEEAVRSKTYDKAFETTPLETEVPNAYRNLILGLCLFLLAFFGILFQMVPVFLIFGAEVGVKMIEVMLDVISLPEIVGVASALFVYVVVIIFRGRTSDVISPL